MAAANVPQRLFASLLATAPTITISTNAERIVSAKIIIDGVQLPITGAGMTDAEARKDILDRAGAFLLHWNITLGRRDDKYLVAESLLTSQITSLGVRILCIPDNSFVMHAKLQMLCALLLRAVNALANSNGGVVFIGASADQMITGLKLTRDQVDELIAMFSMLTDLWTPAFKQPHWRVWPVYPESHLLTGEIVKDVETMYQTTEARGLVWGNDQLVVLGAKVTKSDVIHWMPHDHVDPRPDCSPYHALHYIDHKMVFVDSTLIPKELLSAKRKCKCECE